MRGGKHMSNAEYREFLIKNILEWAGDRFDREYLEKRSTTALERIHDNC